MCNWMYQTTCLGRHRGTFPGWLNLILPWFGSKCERRSHWFVPTLGLSSLSRGRTRYCPERHFSENSRSRRWCPASQIPDINQNDAFPPLDLDEVQLPPSCDLSPIMVLPHRLSLLPSVCHISLSWFYIPSSMSFTITSTICHLLPFHFPVSAVQGKKQETKGMDFWHGALGQGSKQTNLQHPCPSNSVAAMMALFFPVWLMRHQWIQIIRALSLWTELNVVKIGFRKRQKAAQLHRWW